MINYSIIIPHKNTSYLLEKCIKSIPQREDVQIIVVDDNSNEDNVEKLHFIEQCYQHLSIYYLDKADANGAGHARNVGLKYAKGNWVLFADSDDTFDTNVLNMSFDRYVNHEYDVIYFSINCLDIKTGLSVNNADLMYLNHLYSKEDAENECRYEIQVPWGKFIKRKLVENLNIRFDETIVGNDAWFSLQIGFYASRIRIDHAKLYNWMIRSGSITSNRNEETLLIHINLANKLNRFKEIHGLTKYRSNILAFIPMLVRANVPVFKAVSICVNHTSVKYIVMDVANIFHRWLRHR